MKKIIERLEAARVEKKLSFDDLAKIAEVAKGNVYKTLTGKSEPAASTLFKIAEALGFEIMMVIKGNSISELFKPNADDFTGAKEVEEKYSKENLKLNNKGVAEVKKLVDKTIKPSLNTQLAKSKKSKVAKIAETVESIKKQDECPNCTYVQTGTGIRIRTIKCEEHRTTKKKK